MSGEGDQIELSREPEAVGSGPVSAATDLAASGEAQSSAMDAPEEKPDYRVSPATLLERRRTAQTVYVFDIREVEAFQEWHLPGAYSLPFEYLEPNLHRMPFSGDMLFYDGGEGAAAQAAELLHENGFTDQGYVDEGAEALRRALLNDEAETNYAALSEPERAVAIERVLDDKVREFLASDGGGLEVVAIEADRLLVAYQGACGGCSSSTAGTLKFIQSSLTIALNHEIEVVPT